ncbi:MAG: FHA domain-containing protein, partial [Planctomyces sp.]
MIRATLLVTKGSNRGSRFELTSAHDAVIGRSVDSNIRLDDSEVSRHHARLSFDGLHFVLRDLGSANGCRVNGHPVRERVLEDGDTLALGTSQLTFQLSDSSHPAMPDAG